MIRYGASFSVPYAKYLGLRPKTVLKASLEDLGVRRLRLMSYWNLHEAKQGKYDFSELDWQIKMASEHGAEVTLCLGLRQPRWPESHWPKWAKELPDDEWQMALLNYIEAVVKRYRRRRCIVSYQLENEALLKSFGEGGNFDRERLVREFELVKELDPERPVVMTTSDSWGIPWRDPKPDMFGFSIYRYFFDKGQYRSSHRGPAFYALRGFLVRFLRRRKVFIHELQAEPWGPKGMVDMSVTEQYKSINPARVREAVAFADEIGLYPVDIWGLEWWYWLKSKKNKPTIWNFMRTVYGRSTEGDKK